MGKQRIQNAPWLFLTNRMRFNESLFFIAVDENEKAIGFVQLFPRLSSLQLQRYWQITDIFCVGTCATNRNLCGIDF